MEGISYFPAVNFRRTEVLKGGILFRDFGIAGFLNFGLSGPAAKYNRAYISKCLNRKNSNSKTA